MSTDSIAIFEKSLIKGSLGYYIDARHYSAGLLVCAFNPDIFLGKYCTTFTRKAVNSTFDTLVNCCMGKHIYLHRVCSETYSGCLACETLRGLK